MKGPRRISFYLKPDVVKCEACACNWLDSLPAAERSRAQRAAFLAGLALLKTNPAEAGRLAAWDDEEIPLVPATTKAPAAPQPAPAQPLTSQLAENIRALFPE
ncbi:plasmid partitioning/stability family protein [Escherichia coli]|uniref:plasmid partitioning/stability family protein n=1 Tax=Escherichia coli TaxID=562 RepID=UPI00287B1C74|nr:plasmid partitioning/stability family protein [Escherichia coli]MDS1619825.1 plasmid partitioning/stability family protein [Escherichia coli]